MSVKTETLPRDGGFVLSEAPGSYCREPIVVLADEVLRAGHVLGKAAYATPATDAPFAGNTGGSGVIGTVVVAAGAKVGRYKVVIVEPASNAGKFLVFDPDGILVGVGTVAVEFVGGGLTFTVADATDFVAGDGFNIDVAAGTGKYRELELAGTAGDAVAAGILFGEVDATGADTAGTAIVRGPCEVRATDLTWPSGITTDQKNAAIAQLATLGIIVRAGPATVQVGPSVA